MDDDGNAVADCVLNALPSVWTITLNEAGNCGVHGFCATISAERRAVWSVTGAVLDDSGAYVLLPGNRVAYDGGGSISS